MSASFTRETIRLYSEHSFAAVQCISINKCLDNLFVFSGSTPNTTVLRVKHKECGRFLQIVLMWDHVESSCFARQRFCAAIFTKILHAKKVLPARL